MHNFRKINPSPLQIVSLSFILFALVGLNLAFINFKHNAYEPKIFGSEISTYGPSLKEFVGANVVVNNSPSDIAQTVGWVRDYHKWYWYEPTDNNFTWSTSKEHVDVFYNNLASLGVKVMPDVEFAPGWASSNGQKDGIPNAAKHAEYLKDLVTYFSGTISAVENYNEPNQWWQPIKFPADQFGGMTKLDYDAVKAANPNVLFVLAGVLGADTGYLSKANTVSGGKFDVINYHWYTTGDTYQGGRNPESGGLIQNIDTMKKWRNTYAPNKQIWITEFGWDTFQYNGKRSAIYAPEAAAANYLLRSIFLANGRGIDKVFMYMYRDVYQRPANLVGQYMSSGLVEDVEVYSGDIQEMDGRKKTGWYYLATLRNILGDYSFNRIVKDGPSVYHYEYILPATGQKAAVLWARSGDRDRSYKTAYQGPAGTLIQFANNSTTGMSSETNGKLTLTEKPVIILFTSTDPASPTSTPTPNPVTDKIIIPTPTSPIVPTPTAMTSSPSPIQNTPTESSLTNGNFEEGVSSWMIPSWFANNLSADSSLPHSGVLSLHGQGKGSGIYAQQDIKASAGNNLNVTGFVNITAANGSTSLVVEVQPLNQYGGNLGNATSITNITGKTSGWIQVSGSALMPSNTAKARIRVRFPTLDGTAYIDDLSVIGAN